MDQIEIALALAIGFAGGYAVRSAISARRRRIFYRLRQAEALRAIEDGKALALKHGDGQAQIAITLAP
jgi:hypothetical protein